MQPSGPGEVRTILYPAKNRIELDFTPVDRRSILRPFELKYVGLGRNIAHLLEGDQVPRKRKTENRSFRLDASTLGGLEQQAERKKVSVNTLVSQILTDYVETSVHWDRLGTMTIQSNVFKLLFDAVSEKGLLESAAWGGANIPKAYVLNKWGSLSVDNLMNYIKDSAQRGLYEYSETSQGGRIITLNHTLGIKWSHFLSIYMKLAFQTFGATVETDYNDKAVAIKL
jgi:hypothetical protein